jgi:hypothetical protein
MRRYYIAPKSVWLEPIDIGGTAMPRHNLMPACHYVELDDGHILICTQFRSPWAEDQWHSHPEVARLTDPIAEASVPLAGLQRDPAFAHKQFQQHHFAKLQALVAKHGHALSETHTVRDLHYMLAPHYPGMRLSFY